MKITYKEYSGEIEFSADDNVYHGKINNISDLVTFEGDTIDQAQDAFKMMVIDYIKTKGSAK